MILAAVLYVMVTGPIDLDRDRPEIMGPVVAGSGTESVIIIASVPLGKLPESTYVLIRDANGNVPLARTRFSALTSANWTTYHVRYDDASPAVAEIAPSDRIIVNRGHYPPPIVLEISDGIRILATQSL